MKISIFDSLASKPRSIELEQILADIKSGKYKDKVMMVRSAVASGDIKNKDIHKRQLAGVTCSGVFEYRRVLEKLIQYNQVICVDYDDLSEKELDAQIKKVNADKHTFVSFISPSGNGLKVLVKVDSGVEDHATAFQQVFDYYKRLTGHQSDPTVKDITRLCFVSYDPDLYHNPESKVFNVVINKTKAAATTQVQSKTVSLSTVDHNLAFWDAAASTAQILRFGEGYRNNFVHLLACNMNRAGIPEDDTLKLILTYYGYDLSEVTKTVRSAYKNNPQDFGQGEVATPTQKSNDSLFVPRVFEGLVELLPEPLKSWVAAFTDSIDKDLAGLSILSLVAVLIDKPYISYGDRMLFAQFFLMVIAPPASGKGSLSHTRDLGDLIAKKEEEELPKREEQHRKECEACLEDPACITPPPKAEFNLLFIPGNCSHMAMMDELQKNQGKGLIFETEADTLTSTLAHEWGNYSDVLRKSYHHECISAKRIKDDRMVHINTPKLGVLLSGTPDQLNRLMSDVENGLVSRFIFYFFSSDRVWKSQFRTGNVNLSKVKEDVSNALVAIHEKVNRIPIQIVPTEAQIDRFDAFFQDLTEDDSIQESDSLFSSLKRLGVTAAKWLIVISVLRMIERGGLADEWEMEDQDLELVLKMISRLYIHTQAAHHQINPNGVSKQLSGNATLSRFWSALPMSFERGDAVALGTAMGVSERSVNGYLKKGVEDRVLQRLKQGKYKRLDVANTTSVSGVPIGPGSEDLNSIVNPIKN
ncbi:MAG: DUF3987 domain-containing protein [Saprospiraceae bacterium]